MNTITSGINLSDPAPHKEPERQYYFIEKAKEYVRKEAEEAGRPMTFCVTTFGCQMNARDSEKLRGILLEIGYEEAAEEEADFVIFNTCTVRENANTRVYGRLGQRSEEHTSELQSPRGISYAVFCLTLVADLRTA